jgi:Nucleotidyl transferase AbiEii toxin, Type IV TA system
MATRSVISAGQRRALAVLSQLRVVADDLYLAGGVAVAMHLGHRTSLDLDFFSRSSELDLDQVQAAVVETSTRVQVIARSDATLHLRFEGADLDVVRYPYPPLVRPRRQEPGFYVASLRDLAAMKLAAIATRGIRRDFWDLHAILTSGRSTLRRAFDDYTQKFGVTESDVYHVLRALSWFEDAERDEVFPRGLSKKHWRAIRSYFEAAARSEIERRAK